MFPNVQIDPSDQDKYIVVCVAKDENQYIVEWINHYFNIGFDKIIIGDNNPVGDDSLLNLLEDYVLKGLVQIVDCRGVDRIQIPFYNTYSTCGKYKWAAYFDVDEFLEFNSDKQSIKEVLADVKEDIVCVNWMAMSNEETIFSSSDKVVDRYKKIVPTYYAMMEDRVVKTMLRGGTKHTFTNGHIVQDEGGCVYNIGLSYTTTNIAIWHDEICWKHLYLKHYRTKSFIEFKNKCNRGACDGVMAVDYSTYLLYSKTPRIALPLKTKIYPKYTEDKLYISCQCTVEQLIDNLKNILTVNKSKTIVLCGNIQDKYFTYCYEICNACDCRLMYSECVPQNVRVLF